MELQAAFFCTGVNTRALCGRAFSPDGCPPNRDIKLPNYFLSKITAKVGPKNVIDAAVERTSAVNSHRWDTVKSSFSQVFRVKRQHAVWRVIIGLSHHRCFPPPR
jgi:hypothetical protein